MAKFKVAVRYKGSCCEDIVEIEADSAEKARKRCSEMVEENRIAVEKSAKKGIYISRSIVDCRLHNLDWRDEFIQCMNLNSENEV
ncbi:hypothetical protein EBT16_00690 [bacterium]|nr:hypothetical protein [bacterium]